MSFFDPSKITTWISLSAAALLLIAFVAKMVLNSEAIVRVTRANTYSVLKSIINKAFYLALVIVLISAAISIFDSYINNKMRETASEMQKSQQLIQEWSLLEIGDRKTALSSLKSAAVNFNSYENFFMYATALSSAQDHELALINYDRALAIRQTKEGFLNKGVAEQNLGKIDEAINSFKKGLLADSNSYNGDIFQSKLYFNLASAHLDVFQSERGQQPDENDLKLAASYIEKADSGLRASSEYQGSLYALKALLHQMQKNYVQAAKFYEKALLVRKANFYSSEQARDVGVTSNNIASLLVREPFNDDLDNKAALKAAKEYSTEALQIFNNGKFGVEAAFAEYNFAEASKKTGDKKTALEFFEKSKSSFLMQGIDNYGSKIDSEIAKLR